MEHPHTTNAVSRTTHRARLVAPLTLLATFLLGSAPEAALADQIVIINQPDDYVVLDPIADRRRMIVEEPEPSWVLAEIAPPQVRVEVRPRPPFAGAIWVSGYWWWSGAHYVWIDGHYVRPVAGYRFVAPRWVFSGGYYYHVRGHYRPHGATVRHRPYGHYRQVGYYGHRDPRGYRYTTPRSQHPGYGRPYRADDDDHRGHGRGYDRDDDARRGHGRGYSRDDDARRGRGDEQRGHGNGGRGNGAHGQGHGKQHRDDHADARGRGAPHRASPPARRVSPVARGQSSRSPRVAQGGNSRRGSGAGRTRQ